MSKGWKEGFYTPRNPEKYVGDLSKLSFKSSWEEYAFKFLDNNIKVLKWGYEIVPIAYQKPVPTSIDKRGWRPATYFPDLYVEYIHRDGSTIKELVEVKPLKQTKSSKSKNESTRLNENYVHLVNQAKWIAAKAWCERYKIKFSILTEKSLFR